MKENIIKNKSFAFAIRVIKLCEYLRNEHKEFILAKQLLRSGTAIGALVRESEQAESKPDFIHKMSIALKEASETDYWLELLFKSEYLKEIEYTSMKEDNDEILRLLVSIIKTAKSNSGKL
ncbi:MAG: four helix bundle protein [Ignavibacteriales bacterium]|nr:MAG: four helix bundle protein [Ignavibacteriales bacterium]